MKPPVELTEIIEGKRYSTKTATLLAGDDYWDGKNWERGGRNIFLYRTPNGAYFEAVLVRFDDERDGIVPLTQEQAIGMYSSYLSEHRVSFELAFPGVEIVDA